MTRIIAALLALSMVALGRALQVQYTAANAQAIFWLTCALACCAAAVLLQPRHGLSVGANSSTVVEKIVAAKAVTTVFCIGLLVEYLQPLVTQAVTLSWFLLVVALVAGWKLAHSSWLAPAYAPAILAVHILIGGAIVYASPMPVIDVQLFQRDSLNALLHGIDPYTISVPDIHKGDAALYGPGIVANGRVNIGCPYPPLSLFLALPGHLLGDYRLSLVVAITLSGAMLLYGWPGRGSMGAALFLLFSSTSLLVLQWGWTEPLVVLGLAATMFCAQHARRWLPLSLGLFIASKQYGILLLPLAALLLPRPLSWKCYGRLVASALLVALIATAPLALWNPHDFVRNVITFQLNQPLRLDSLSYMAWAAKGTGSHFPSWPGFAAAIGVIILALWRCPRSPGGFASAVALTFLVFFAFAKQAFTNYYFFVMAALSFAVAALLTESSESDA